jgi:hypothetical protein
MRGSMRRPFPLFAAGAVLFALALAAWVNLGRDDLMLWLALLTPLFGLPYLVLGARARWRTALYVLLLLPAFHFAAIWGAMYSVGSHNASGYVAGAAGGVIGALLSFLALAALRLVRPRPLAAMAAGLVVLALLGAVGIQQMDFLSDTGWSQYGLILSLSLPWQLAFAFLLARLLRPAEQSEAI